MSREVHKEMQSLRKKQWMYRNIFFLCCVIAIWVCVVYGATRREIYLLLGIGLVLSAVSLHQKVTPFFWIFKEMKEIGELESDRLGDRWNQYYFPAVLLRGILGGYFLLQAALYGGDRPFRDGLPLWYWILIPVILMVVQNVNMRLHAKRIHTKTTEELAWYSQEKMLFTVIFASVASVVTLIGFILVICMS